MTKKLNNEVAFILKGIKTDQFAIIEENYCNEKEVKLNSEFQFKIDPKNNQLGVFIEFEFLQEEKVFLKIQVSCHFVFEKKSWESFYQDNSLIVIPKGILAHLAMITIGTTRGVLFSKTENTQFSNHTIPLINVAHAIKEDISFPISK